ncbi:anthranilate/aminodeoxychorismate synthase component II, partial [Halobacteriales archaeon QS_4_69_31]
MNAAARVEEAEVLFVDNFDSFTYNLVEYVSEHAATEVLRNTATIEEVR